MRVAVIGASGQLGTDVTLEFAKAGYAVTALAHSDVDIASLESLRNALHPIEPSIVVNTAAMHHVESCEKAPGHAYEVNTVGCRNLAMVSRELSAKVVHVSTDYVFDGSKYSPYLECDEARPLNVYGSSKLAGETYLAGLAEKYFVLRTSALYGTNPCRAKGGLNFVELMLRLANERDELRVVDDEFVSPTPSTELARQIVALAGTEAYGLYHATSEGGCSWYSFAAAIFEMTGTTTVLKAAHPGEFPAKVPRPKYSVLENSALKKLGLNTFPHWRDGLQGYLAARSASVRLAHGH